MFSTIGTHGDAQRSKYTNTHPGSTCTPLEYTFRLLQKSGIITERAVVVVLLCWMCPAPFTF